MSKRAEEKALEAYPVKQRYNDYYGDYEDMNIVERISFQEGYEQAEKDLALTAEDVGCIIHLADQFGKDYQKIADVFNKDREEEK